MEADLNLLKEFEEKLNRFSDSLGPDVLIHHSFICLSDLLKVYNEVLKQQRGLIAQSVRAADS